MKLAYFWILLLVAVGALITLYLIPSGEELALIQLKSQKYSEAEQFYIDEYNKGVRTPGIIYELSILYEKKGDLDQAIQLIREYVRHNPDDVDALKRLLDLYYLDNKYKDYEQTLIKLYDLHAKLDIDSLRELKDSYQTKETLIKKEALLKEILLSGKADENDYRDLATLYVQENQFAKAAEVLKDRRTLFPKASTADMILFEFWVNTHLGQIKRESSLEMVADYLKTKKDNLTTSFVLNQFKELYPKDALKLLSLLGNDINNSLKLQTIKLLILWDHPDQKETVQRDAIKLEKYAKNDRALQNFIFDIYLDENNEKRLLHYIETTPVQKLEERKIIDLSILAIYREQPAIARAMQKALGAHYLKDHPLAALALTMGAQEKEARAQFDLYLKNHKPTRTESLFLFKLGAAAKYDEEILKIGQQFPPFIGMKESDLLEIAQAYAGMKKADLLYPSLASAVSTGGIKVAGPALALLNIATHRSQAAMEWMKTQPLIKQETLKAFFEVAKENQQAPLELYIAQRLMQDYPSVSSQSSYGLALIENGMIQDGINILKKLYAEHPLNSQIQRDYLSSLVIATKKDQKYAHELRSLMFNWERQGHLSKNRLREFGYIYIETLHDFNKAKQNFYILSNETPVNEEDVQTLIYLWGPKVNEEQALWIERKALQSHPKNLGYWLETLNYIGHFQSTICLFEQRFENCLNQKAYFAYMQALAVEQQPQKLKQIIDFVFPILSERKHLEELSTYAEIAGYVEARVRIWQKIACEYSDDPLAWQNLSRALYDMHAFCMARTSLEIFFSLEDGSNSKLYESYYEYAEVLRKQRYFALSKCYYILTLNLINSDKAPTLNMQEIAAQAYYQLNEYRMGLDVMKNYFEQTGRDADAAAIYANMLMDVGLLKAADKLLDRTFSP